MVSRVRSIIEKPQRNSFMSKKTNSRSAPGRILLSFFTCIAIAFGLIACGGGSSGNGSDNSTSNTPTNIGPTSNSLGSGPGKFALVANAGSNNITVLNINSTGAPLTNTLTSTFSPYITDYRTPVSLAVDSTYGHVYVAENAGFVGVFHIDSNTGALSETSGSPYIAGNSPSSLVLDPTGNFLYVANFYSMDVSVYSVNRSAGTLTPVAGSPFNVGSQAVDLAINPANGCLYVVTLNNGVNVFSVNRSTGALTPISGSPFAAGAGLVGRITFTSTGKFAYIAGGNGTAINSIGAFVINSTTGSMTQIQGSPYSAGSYSTSVTLDPSEKFAYVPNEGSNSISVFSINSSTGALTEIAGSPFSSIRSYPTSITFDRTGSYAFVTNGSTVNSIETFSFNSTTGVLSILPGYLLTTQLYNPLSMVFY